LERPPLERTAGVARLYEEARIVAFELGYELAEAGRAWIGRELHSGAGVPRSMASARSATARTALHEHIDIDSLPDRAALVAGLIIRIQ